MENSGEVWGKTVLPGKQSIRTFRGEFRVFFRTLRSAEGL